MRSVKTAVILGIIAILGFYIWNVTYQKNEIKQEVQTLNESQLLTFIEQRTIAIIDISREQREKELYRETQRERVYFFGGIFAAFIVAGIFPRFGMYVLGPGILMATLWFIFGDKGAGEFLFSSGGDGWTGLGKLIIWIGIFLACSFGVGIIAFSRACLRKKAEEDYADY